MPTSLSFGIIALWTVFLNLSCSLLLVYPEDISFEERMDSLPVGHAPIDKPIKIYWHEKGIPFIEAQSDLDGSFALGLVTAHLRLGQLEIFRLVSQGRLSEVAGPIPQVATIDHGLRMLAFSAAAKKPLFTYL